MRRICMAKAILEMNEFGEMIELDVKTYYKAALIKTEGLV